MKTLAVALAVAVPAVPAAAQAPLSFEGALGQVRAQAEALGAERAKARDSRLPSEIQQLASNVDVIAWELPIMKQRVANLRIAVRLPHNIGLARLALHQAVQDMQVLGSALQQDQQAAARLAARAAKNPDAVQPAKDLAQAAQSVQLNARALLTQARFGRWDFQRTGFSPAALQLERLAGNIERAARALQLGADQLLRKVR